MRIKTRIKSGKLSANHNQAVKGLRVRSSFRAGRLAANHNQTVTR